MTVAVARRRAQALLRRLGSGDLPVDVRALAAELGVTVVSQPLEATVSGVLVLRNGYAAIGVNDGHHPRRQRFTIAHELGHFVLHREADRLFVDESLTFYRDQQSAEGLYEREIAANAFAAELLMPEVSLRAILGDRPIDLHDDTAIQHLAARFDVSVQALTIRLVNLGLASA
jgi:Zn-dependent peptidase ImmA (M78 family)